MKTFMSNIVGLSSISSSCMDLTYIQTPELTYGHLFTIDRLIRAAYKENSKADWKYIVTRLEIGGYLSLPNSNESNIFLFFRPWDEYLLNDGESFLVTFSETAAYELRNKIFLATPYPLFYTSVGSSYSGGGGRVLLINDAHELIYPDDIVWQDAEQTQKSLLDQVHLFKDQFPTEFEYFKARDILVSSGYRVSDTPCILQSAQSAV